MAREGRVFKTTAGNEVLRDYDTTLRAVRQWLVQNEVPNVTDTMCKEHMDEFVQRFKIVEEVKESQE